MTVLFTFLSVHHALKAEKILRTLGLEFDIIPTPRSISSSCGMSIIIESTGTALGAAEQIEAAGISIAAQYHSSDGFKWSKDGGEERT